MRYLAAAFIIFAAIEPPCLAAADDQEFQLVVVKPGDTMWAIANKYLKDPSRWDEILKHNTLPTKDPTVALPGLTLRVPVRLIKAQLRAAHLVYAVNRVLYRRKETASWKSGQLAQELFQGDTLRTLDESKARVKLLDKELLSLEPNSMAVIKPSGRDGDLELQAGSVFAGRARWHQSPPTSIRDGLASSLCLQPVRGSARLATASVKDVRLAGAVLVVALLVRAVPHDPSAAVRHPRPAPRSRPGRWRLRGAECVGWDGAPRGFSVVGLGHDGSLLLSGVP